MVNDNIVFLKRVLILAIYTKIFMDKIITGIFFKIIQCRRKVGESIDEKKRKKILTMWMDRSMGVHLTILSSVHLQIFITKPIVKSYPEETDSVKKI